MSFLLEDLKQIRALIIKTIILQWRQYKTNIFQLALPVICLTFIFLMQVIFNALQFQLTPANQQSIDIFPPTVNLQQLFQVTMARTGVNATFSAPEFFYYFTAPNATLNTDLGTLFANATGNGFLGQGKVFQAPGVRVNEDNTTSLVYMPSFNNSFPSQADLNKFLYQNLISASAKQLIKTAGSFEFYNLDTNISSAALDYAIQFDNASAGNFIVNVRTPFCGFVSGVSVGNCATIVSSGQLNFIHNLFAAAVTQGRALISTSIAQMPFTRSISQLQLINILSIFFFPIILSLPLPLFMYMIVLEKQGKQREMMKLMGMKLRNYFLVLFVFFFVIYLILLSEFAILGAAFQFRFILGVHPFVNFLFLMGYGLALIALAFFLSAFINNTTIANIVGFLVVLLGPLAGGILEQAVFRRDELQWKPFLLIMPLPITHYINAASQECQSLRCPQIPALWQNREIQFAILLVYIDAFIYLVAGLYLSMVWPQAWGRRSSPIFFIDWIWKNCKCLRRKKNYKYRHEEKEDRMESDVLEEKRQIVSGEIRPDDCGVLLECLVKKYGQKRAVNGVYLHVGKNECFGLLGKNGAGKSTTANILSGLFKQTSGKAFMYGYDLDNQFDKIQKILGLCPQFDIIWDDLTPMEHLLFYARIKNVPIKEEKKHAEELLRAVGLNREILKRNPKASQLSGGMKRRLSLAMSLVGDPKIVLLDEPSSGLDPKTRKHLWKVIAKAKKERCVILTTHYLEEADVLCDRIGIFSRGYLKALGTSMHLKSKYGQGYKLTISYLPDYKDKIIAFVNQVFPHGMATLSFDFADNFIFDLLKQNPQTGEPIRLSATFRTFEEKKKELGIVEWCLNQTSLEDVFLNIVGKDEEKQAPEDNLDQSQQQQQVPTSSDITEPVLEMQEMPNYSPPQPVPDYINSPHVTFVDTISWKEQPAASDPNFDDNV